MAKKSSTWKSHERRTAKVFGSERNRLSGSSGRDDVTSSDSTHERLYIECKWRGQRNLSVVTLFLDAKEKGKREKKTPVLSLKDKRIKGTLFVIHSSDLENVLIELNKAKDFLINGSYTEQEKESIQ